MSTCEYKTGVCRIKSLPKSSAKLLIAKWLTCDVC